MFLDNLCIQNKQHNKIFTPGSPNNIPRNHIELSPRIVVCCPAIKVSMTRNKRNENENVVDLQKQIKS